MDFLAKFASGLTYHEFLAKYGSEEHRRRWDDFHGRVSLTSEQRSPLGSFTRNMPVMCLAGAWCGDCVNQCPIFEHFAAAAPGVDLRFFDRDADGDLAELLQMCGGKRVPMVLFLSEDGFEVGRYGDRTLSKYRQVVASLAASSTIGASCSTGIVAPASELTAAVTQDWLNEFERAQWVLRTSSRLRQKHGD
jgi:thiol-disulfide isomerase/thioredoxin